MFKTRCIHARLPSLSDQEKVGLEDIRDLMAANWIWHESRSRTSAQSQISAPKPSASAPPAHPQHAARNPPAPAPPADAGLSVSPEVFRIPAAHACAGQGIAGGVIQR